METITTRTNLLQALIGIVEIASAVILLTGFFKGIIRFVAYEWSRLFRTQTLQSLGNLRPVVGTYILLGLDFYIVSDILSTMLHPELNELISLTVIGLLRTTIGYFLAKEIGKD